MQRNYDLYIEHMLIAVDRIEEYISGYTKKFFSNDHKTVDAVVRQLTILGEAVSRLPQNLKSKYPDIPWQDIKDFRNVVVHKYEVVDKEELWNIIKNELKPLRKKLELILSWLQ